MNKEEHLLFVIILFLFTLTFGKKWMEEYIGHGIENFDPNISLLSAGMSGGNKNEKNKTIEGFSKNFKQKTNNDKYSTEDAKSKNMVIESFVTRKPTKCSSRINMY